MRALIRGFDGLMRRANGVFEFCDDEECLLRLQLARASQDLDLSDGTRVQAGDRVVMLHLWNERITPPESAGSDLAWAANLCRRLIYSLQAAARWLAGEPGLASVRAIGGATVLVSPGDEGGGYRLMQRLGFDVFPCTSPLGRFGEFWENLYAWGLMWAFNEASLRQRSLLRLRRAEVWMSIGKLIARYGPARCGRPLA